MMTRLVSAVLAFLGIAISCGALLGFAQISEPLRLEKMD